MKKKSQKQNVIDHLVEHGSITPLEALNLYGIFRLGAIIHTLRHKHKMNIKSKISDGNKNFAIYSWENIIPEPVKDEKENQNSLFDMEKLNKKKFEWPD
jgi:hypothetical protein